jgi:hypothetical protein
MLRGGSKDIEDPDGAAEHNQAVNTHQYPGYKRLLLDCFVPLLDHFGDDSSQCRTLKRLRYVSSGAIDIQDRVIEAWKRNLGILVYEGQTLLDSLDFHENDTVEDI